MRVRTPEDVLLQAHEARENAIEFAIRDISLRVERVLKEYPDTESVTLNGAFYDEAIERLRAAGWEVVVLKPKWWQVFTGHYIRVSGWVKEKPQPGLGIYR